MFQAWDGLKTRAKRAFNAKKAYMNGTGKGVSPDLAQLGLSSIYKRTIELIGMTSIVGHTAVPDPLEVRHL
jgi:hypothetical protein